MLSANSVQSPESHFAKFSGEDSFTDLLDDQFDDVEVLLRDLHLKRQSRITALRLEAQAQLEKDKHEREMARIQKQKEEEAQKHELEQQQKRRVAELKVAQAKAEEERAKRAAEAKRLAHEEERLRKEKEQREKQEAEERRQKERQEKADREKALAEAEQERKEKAEADRRNAERAKLEAQQRAEAEAEAQTKAQAGAEATRLGGTSRSQVEQEHAKYMDRIQWIKTNVKEAISKQPKEVKNLTMDIKLQLRPRFGQLTNSKSQLIQCREAVKSIFEQARNVGPLILHWVFNLFAKMLIEQSESEANVKHQNALPLAMLTVLLWSDYPELGEFVIPRFVKRCPQIIGYYCNIDTSQGRKKMGWRKDDDTGKYETQEQYMGRLSGICAVWSCMTQTKLSAKVTQADHPYPLSHSWKFLARQLNKPLQDVTHTDYALVAAWWDMTAMRFNEAFGKQAEKLLNLAWDTWTANKMEPPAMRLRGLGENWKATGKIEAAWKPLQP